LFVARNVHENEDKKRRHENVLKSSPGHRPPRQEVTQKMMKYLRNILEISIDSPKIHLEMFLSSPSKRHFYQNIISVINFYLSSTFVVLTYLLTCANDKIKVKRGMAA